MSNSRREFLSKTSLGLLATAAAPHLKGTDIAGSMTDVGAQDPTQQLPAGAPPAYGTGPAVGPEVSVATFSEAEKVVRVELTSPDLAQAASTWRVNMAALYERRTGPRAVPLEPTLAPFSSYIYHMPDSTAT